MRKRFLLLLTLLTLMNRISRAWRCSSDAAAVSASCRCPGHVDRRDSWQRVARAPTARFTRGSTSGPNDPIKIKAEGSGARHRTATRSPLGSSGTLGSGRMHKRRARRRQTGRRRWLHAIARVTEVGPIARCEASPRRAS
jgi:hypothetical protein